MDFIRLCKEAYENAEKHGWHEAPRSYYEIKALFHSEISEAVEDCRKGRPPIYWTEETKGRRSEGYPPENVKPEGEVVELADVCIRIFDYIGGLPMMLPDGIKDQAECYEMEPESWMMKKAGNKPIEFYGLLHHCIERTDVTLGEVVKLIEQWCTARGWDLENAITKKMKFNESRPWKHGNKLH